MDDLFEYNEHDGGDDAGGSGSEGAEGGEDSNGESRPARIDAERCEKDGDKAGRRTGQEKGKHPVGGCSDKREGGDDVCRQGNSNLHFSICSTACGENNGRRTCGTGQ